MEKFLTALLKINEGSTQCRELKLFTSSIQFYALYPEFGVKERYSVRYSFEQVKKVITEDLALNVTDQDVKHIINQLDRSEKGHIMAYDFLRCLECQNLWKYVKKFKTAY